MICTDAILFWQLKQKNAQFVSEVKQTIVAFATFDAIFLCAD